MNSVNLSQAIGTSPGVYGNLTDAPPFPETAPRSVAAFPVESTKGRRGPAKVPSREDYVAEYGHNPTFSLTSYGPLMFLQESNRVVVSRVLHNAKEAGAMLCVVPHEAATPEGMGGTTVLRPFIVGSENGADGIRLSDDYVLAIYDRSPGQSEKRVRLVPEINNPDGGFHVEVYIGNSTNWVERHHVKLTDYQNGYGEQMHIEQVINTRSRQIGVVLNTAVQNTIYVGDNLIDSTLEVWLNGGDQGDPAHEQVDGQGQLPLSFPQPEFLRDAHRGQPPDCAEERPAQVTAQADERERRVGACDQQIDGIVIQLSEHRFGATPSAVVERGETVQQHQGRPVDRKTDDFPDVPGHRAKNDQDDASRQGEQCAHKMAIPVEPFSVIHRLQPDCAAFPLPPRTGVVVAGVSGHGFRCAGN